MTGELGQLALALALALSLVQIAACFAGAMRRDERLMEAGRSAALGAFVFIAVAFGSLMTAYVGSDFSLLVVAENSHTAKPLLYKISGVWGNHEGSMLLWLLVLAMYSAAIAFTRAGGVLLSARALGVQGLIAATFLLFVLFTSNPFLRLDPPPFEGAGLNPILQDPGLAFHPPLLYLGYVGLSGVFSYAVAALWEGRGGKEWVVAARPFALIAWIALTLGIALGSWWAYYTLGWGGFWFWDPVENASLMPWLVATALIHSIMATAKTGAFKSWTLFLAIAAFSFSLIGTFLVRSGVLTSVHAFANDPARGVFILAILVAVIGGSLALFAWRAPRLASGAPFEPVSRESAILLNNLLLTAAAASVCIGTLYPLALEALTGAKISVGPPYFVITFMPLMATLAVIMPFGPLLVWRKSELKTAFHALRAAIIAALAAMVLTLALARPNSVFGIFAIGLGVWLIAGAVVYIARRAGAWRNLRQVSATGWGMALAHAGLGVVALGVAGATIWKSEAIDVLGPGQSLAIAGYTLRLENVGRMPGPNYVADRATFTVFADGRAIATMQPEKRNYPVEGQTISKTAIRTTGFSDLYLALGDARDKGRWVVRAYRNPLAPFIWFGAGIMALGSAFSLSARARAVRAQSHAALAAKLA